MMILYNYLAELKKQGVQILHIIVLDPGLQRNDILELYQKEMAGPGYEILCIQKSSLFEKRKHSYEALQSIPPPDEAIEAIKNFHPDVLFCFEMQAGAMFQDVNIAPKVIQVHDLRFVGMWYHTLYGLRENPMSIFSFPLNALRCRQWKQYYCAALQKFDVINSAVASSAVELQKIGLSAQYIPFPWPRLTGNPKAIQELPSKPTFLFLGNLSGLGSRSALHFLFYKAYPALLAQWGKGGFHIIICGANKVSQWILDNIAKRPELEFRGFVEDIDALMQTCHGVLAPMDVKTGNRSRIITAMSLRVPVIAHEHTALGNPALVNNETCLLSSDGATFAKHMQRVTERSPQVQAMIEKAAWVYDVQFDPRAATTYLLEDFYAATLQKSTKAPPPTAPIAVPLQIYRAFYRAWMNIWWKCIRALAVPMVSLEYTWNLLKHRSALRDAEFLYPLWFWSFGHQASDLHHLVLRFPGRKIVVLLSEYGPYNHPIVESFDALLTICRLPHSGLMKYFVKSLGVPRTRRLKRVVLRWVLRRMHKTDVAILPDFNLAPGPRISGLFLCEYLGLMQSQPETVIHPSPAIVDTEKALLQAHPELKGRFSVALYLRRKFSKKSDVRDTPPESYRAAIEKIIEAGGYVFCGADYSAEDVYPGSPYVIGYRDVPFAREYSDAYILTTSSFLIGGHSGPVAITSVFNVPSLVTNNAFFYLSGLRKNQRVVYKKVREKATGRILSVAETFAFPVVYYSDTSHFDRAGLEVVDNTSEEIVAAVEEMLDLFVRRKTSVTNEKHLQQFRALLVPDTMAAHSEAQPALHWLENSLPSK
jgi:putative glycosyltransferase (TIGR04372 family)